jgi:hypothetical protein
MLLNNNLLKIFFLFSISSIAQDSLNPVREAFYGWGKDLRRIQYFKCDFRIEGKSSLIDKIFDSLTQIKGRLAYRLKDNSLEVLNETSLGSYQLNIFNNQAYELLKIIGRAPLFIFHRSLENTKITLLTECFESLNQSEVAFYSCFEKYYKIDLTQDDSKANKITLSSKNPESSGIDSVVLEIEHKKAFPRKLVLKMKDSDATENIILNDIKKAPELKDKRFSIPWPANSEISAYE